MKKIILIVLILLVLLGVGGYFILPSTINWETYTQELSASVKAATGRNLVIQGAPQFSLRPVPTLKLGKITLTNVSGASYPNMLVASGAEMTFDAGALFRRQVKIKKITLKSPQFFIENLQDGNSNWQFGFLQKEATGGGIGFESLLISDGSALVKGDKYSSAQKWQNINAELFADSLQGPFFFEGNVAALGTTFGFSVKTDKMEQNKSPEFSIRVLNAPSETSVSFTGGYGVRSGNKDILEGNVTFEMRKTEQAFAILFPGKTLPSEIFKSLEGNFILRNNSRSRLMEMNDVLFKYGLSSASGKMSIQKVSPEEVTAAETAKLKQEFAGEEDILLRDPANPDKSVSLTDISVEASAVSENTLPKKINGTFMFAKFEAEPWLNNIGAVAEFISDAGNFEKNKDSFKFDLKFEAANYNRDLIRDMKFLIENEKNALKLSSFSASLPGGAKLQADASLKTDKKNPLFSGMALLEAENIAGMLRWLNIAVPAEIPQNLLRNFTGSTEFKIARNGVILEKTSLTLDQMNAKGGLSLRFGTRPAAAVVMQVNELDVDAYFPEARKKWIQQREDIFKSEQRFDEKIKQLFIKLAVLNEYDGALKLEADSVSMADIKTDKVTVDASVIRGTMQIKGFSIQGLVKSSVDLQGIFSGFGGIPSFKEAQIKFNTKQLSNILKFTGISVPKDLTRSDLLYASAKFSGGLDSFELNTNADFGQLVFSASGNVRQTAEMTDFDVVASIDQDNFRSFTRLFTDKYRPALANPGGFSFKGHIIKDDQMIQVLDMETSVGINQMKGGFKLDLSKQVPVLTADISADELVPFSMMPRMNFLDSAAVNISAGSGTVPALKDQSGFFVPFGSKFDLPRNAFDFSFLGNYAAKVQLKSKKMVFDKLELENVDTELNLSANEIGIDLRRAVWQGANVVSLSKIAVSEGAASLFVKLRIANVPASVRAFEFTPADISFGSLTFDVNLQGSGKSAYDMANAAKGKGTVSLTGVDFSGFDVLSAEKALAAPADKTKEAFIQASSAGVTKIEEISSPFTLEQGTVLFAPMILSYDGRKSDKSSFSYNFFTRDIDAKINFNLAGSEMVQGTVLAGMPDFIKQAKGRIGSVEVLSNAEAFINTVNHLKEGEEQKKKQEINKQKQESQALQEAQKKEQLNRLLDLEQKLVLQRESLMKKIDGITDYARQVYQVQKYDVLMKQDLDTMDKLLAGLRAVMKQDVITQAIILEQESKIKKAVFDRETSIANNYTVALTVGTKGLIVDMLRQANDMLIQMAKQKTTYPSLTGISNIVNAVVTEIEKLKAVQEKSDKTEETTQLALMVAEAETIFEKVKNQQLAVNAMVSKEVAQAEAEKEKKRLEKEAKKKAEEEAKKAAEAAAEAEKQKQLAAEKERQSTIVRKEGVQTDRNLRAKSGEKAAFKLLPNEEAMPDAALQKTDETEAKGSIIRRR